MATPSWKEGWEKQSTYMPKMCEEEVEVFSRMMKLKVFNENSGIPK